jgi:hypothetical protein
LASRGHLFCSKATVKSKNKVKEAKQKWLLSSLDADNVKHERSKAAGRVSKAKSTKESLSTQNFGLKMSASALIGKMRRNLF